MTTAERMEAETAVLDCDCRRTIDHVAAAYPAAWKALVSGNADLDVTLRGMLANAFWSGANAAVKRLR